MCCKSLSSGEASQCQKKFLAPILRILFSPPCNLLQKIMFCMFSILYVFIFCIILSYTGGGGWLQSVVLSEWRGPLRRRRRERSSPPPSRPGLHRTQGILLFLSPWWLLIMMFFVMKNKMVMVMTKKYFLTFK